MRRIFLASVLLGAAFGVMPVLAQGTSAAPETAPAQPAVEAPADAGGTMTMLTGEEMLTIIKEIGWTGELTQNDGKPYINANFTDPESGASFDFQVGLYRCDEATKACFDIMFMRSMEASKPVTLKMVNSYNAKQIFGVAYLNNDGTLGQSMSMTLQGGVTRQNIKEVADWWKTIMTGFDAAVTGS